MRSLINNLLSSWYLIVAIVLGATLGNILWHIEATLATGILGISTIYLTALQNRDNKTTENLLSQTNKLNGAIYAVFLSFTITLSIRVIAKMLFFIL
ncbi:MAG: hypothetical protein KF758_16465 [Anaerolineales bacterium]|nr:hypothetical protein [Anaerolineales bacterium]MBX3038506.1 hypothetical protein [Anaerolineales bacterium]